MTKEDNPIKKPSDPEPSVTVNPDPPPPPPPGNA